MLCRVRPVSISVSCHCPNLAIAYHFFCSHYLVSLGLEGLGQPFSFQTPMNLTEMEDNEAEFVSSTKKARTRMQICNTSLERGEILKKTLYRKILGKD